MNNSRPLDQVIETLQLPLTFPPEPLKRELAAIPDVWWANHFHKEDYEGVWTVAPLTAPADSILLHEMTMPRPDCRNYVPTALLETCPAMKHVLSCFQCPWHSVRLLKLAAGARILEHTDKSLSYEDGEVRLHVPVETSPQVDFRLNQKRVHMNPGETWYLNVKLPHSVTNSSPIPRTHLVIDCEVNDWLRNLFESTRQAGKA